MGSSNSGRAYFMLFIGFLAQNLALGTTFGAIGLLLDPVAKSLDVGRSTLSFGIATVVLLNGLTGPWIGKLLDLWSMRYTMLIGCVSGALGFFLAARATTATEYLVSFGLFVGVAFAMMGILPANKIAASWFPNHLGRASGIVNLAVAGAVAPPLFGYLLVELGWRWLHDLFAASFVVMALLTLFVTNPPRPEGKAEAAAGPSLEKPPYRTAIFWLIAVSSGLLNTSGIVSITHGINYAMDSGASVQQGALLLSVAGFSTMAGSLSMGLLSDRFGAINLLILNSLAQALLWLAIIAMPEFDRLLVTVAMMSFCVGGVFPAAMVLIGRAFPAQQFGIALGQLAFVLTPPNFGAAPLAGFLFDRFGNYTWAFSLESLLSALALVILIAGRRQMVSAVRAPATSVRPETQNA